jgi:hypothetical protein
MRQSEHVLYITLVDFLLQLLFLGLVISVIYAIAQRDDAAKLDPKQARDAIESMTEIKKLTGVSDITVLTDELTRLGPLQSAARHAELGREVEDVVAEAGGLEAAKRVLTDQISKRGQGKPSCLENGAKLATFHAYPDRIELGQPLTKEMVSLLSRMGLTNSRVSQLSLREFRAIFEQVKRIEPDCRYNVEVVEHSFDTRPRDTVRTAFITMWLPAASDRR